MGNCKGYHFAAGPLCSCGDDSEILEEEEHVEKLRDIAAFADPSHVRDLLDAATEIEVLRSIVTANEWTIRTVLNDLAVGKVYDATLALETALKTITENLNE